MRLDSNAVLAATNVMHTSKLTPVYEEILPQEKLELQGNAAYGPIPVAPECQ